MDIVELKKTIENKTLNDTFLILQWSDTNFIAKQYVEEIAKNKHLKISYVNDLKGLNTSQNDFFGASIPDTLYVMIIEKFESNINDFSTFNNVIVICERVECEQAKTYVIKIPKLIDWQIKDYMIMKCKGVNQKKLEWLQKISNNNIYRIDNEISKLCIFDKQQQEGIFDLLNEEGGYGDLSESNFFDFTNAIKTKDLNKLRTLLLEIDSIDVEPMGIITMLHKDFKLIIDIKLSKLDSKDLVNEFVARKKISINQFNYYNKYFTKLFNEQMLAKIYKFIVNVDYDLKSGNLGSISSDKNRFIDYLICNLLCIQ